MCLKINCHITQTPWAINFLSSVSCYTCQTFHSHRLIIYRFWNILKKSPAYLINQCCNCIWPFADCSCQHILLKKQRPHQALGFGGTFVLPRNAFALLLNKICIASTHTERISQHIWPTFSPNLIETCSHGKSRDGTRWPDGNMRRSRVTYFSQDDKL